MDTAVGLVKAYLELCGYFVLVELPVRESSRHGYRDVTDLDIIAVRFPTPPAPSPQNGPSPLDIFLGRDPALGSDEGSIDVIVGEVKEGKARINPALRRQETIAFALRRVGCCPEERVPDHAREIARRGVRDMTGPSGMHCRVRLVAFGGHGHASEPGVRTIPLAHCAEVIAGRLRDGREVLRGVQFKDPVLGLFALQAKIGPVEEGVPAGFVEAEPAEASE